MISVIIPLYNKEKAIKETLKSVLNQTYKRFEIIVVDDGSTDRSAEIVREITDERIKYYYKENGGVSAARNYGVLKAKFDWIFFLDADDILLADCLSILIKLSDKYCTVATANFYLKNNNKLELFLTGKKNGILKDNFKSLIFKEVFIRTGNTLFPREFLLKNKFRVDLMRNEDHELFLKFYRAYPIAVTQKPVMIYLVDNASLSKPCTNIKNDFTYFLDFKFKSFYEKIFLGCIYSAGLLDYSFEKDELKKKYQKYNLYKLLWKVVNRYVNLRKALYQLNKDEWS